MSLSSDDVTVKFVMFFVYIYVHMQLHVIFTSGFSNISMKGICMSLFVQSIFIVPWIYIAQIFACNYFS